MDARRDWPRRCGDWRLGLCGLALLACAAMPPGPPLVAAGPQPPPLALPGRPANTPNQQHQQFLWDFSECFDYTVTTSGTDFVDGARLNLPGGCFLRFSVPEQSWLEAIFVLAGDPRAAGGPLGTWRLTLFHLAPAPDDRTRGYAPVRVTLNGQEVWQGSPADEGEFGPGRVWAADEIDVTPYLRSGRNTLRWELLPGAIAPYWLKVVHVGWEPN